MRETVLVTGGAGYIGSHCCKLLASAGYRPVVYDDLSTGHRDFVKWGPLVEGDIRDRGKLVDALAAQRPALVMHFAALALVGESVARPERYWDVNVGGVFALLEAMRATGWGLTLPLIAGLSGLAVWLELAQFLSPGREPDLAQVAGSLAGILLGLILAQLWRMDRRVI